MIKYEVIKKNRIPCLKAIFDTKQNEIVASSSDIYEILIKEGLGEKAEEYLYLFSINIRGRILGIFEVAHGECDFCVTSPAQIIMRILLTGGRRAILAHNHPSGEVKPSDDDIKYTEDVKKAMNIVGIRLMDHVIIGDNCYFSMLDEGLL